MGVAVVVMSVVSTVWWYTVHICMCRGMDDDDRKSEFLGV
jgi:hypothetical protein